MSAPHFIRLHEAGLLATRVDEAMAALARCEQCARRCGINRLEGERGVCRGGRRAAVSSAFAHHGEEAMLSGRHGSGTVFLAGCPLHCVFCQNENISHGDEGRQVGTEDLARLFAGLVQAGCHNLNFVTPSHYLVPLLEALHRYAESGPSQAVPVVWNCGGYESPEGLALLDGIVDVYMPDFKWLDGVAAERYAGAPDYPEVVCVALDTMFHQVGPVRFDGAGLLQGGLLIRHLVMPGLLEDSLAIIDYVADRFGREVVLNVMGQYHPSHRAHQFPEIARALPRTDWLAVREHAVRRGLRLA